MSDERILENSPHCIDQITFLVVTYNNADTIDKCINSIPQGSIVRVFDNASEDSTCDRIRSRFPSVTLFASAQNIGFGRGHNRLLTQVETPFAFLVNPDAVLKEGCVDILYDTMRRHPKAAIAAPLELSEDSGEIRDKTQACAIVDDERSVDFVSGAMMLLRMSCFEGTFFDENIFLYYEDNDICKSTIDRGWEIIENRSARFVHKGSYSSDGTLRRSWLKGYYMGWGYAYFRYKHYKANAERDVLKYARKNMRHVFLRLLQGKIKIAVVCLGAQCGVRRFDRTKFPTTRA